MRAARGSDIVGYINIFTPPLYVHYSHEKEEKPVETKRRLELQSAKKSCKLRSGG